MKNTRKLIPAFIMLLVSAIMMSTASFAWFSMNSKVNVNNMQVQATADSSLVISQTVKGLDDATIKVDYADTENKIKPVTYKEEQWQVPSASAKIDPATGQATVQEGESLYTPISTNTGYYIDYVVYLASAGAKQNGELSATVTFTGATLETRATSVAFLVLSKNGEAPIKNDLSTMNAQTKFTTIVNKDSKSLTVELGNFEFNLNTDINKSGTDYNNIGCIAVVMRVYIDGALEELIEDPENEGQSKKSGKLYVRSDEVSLKAVTVNVEFNLS